MKLGGKSRDVDSFVDQLKEEGENVVATKGGVFGIKPAVVSPQIVNTEPCVTKSCTDKHLSKFSHDKVFQVFFLQIKMFFLGYT